MENYLDNEMQLLANIDYIHVRLLTLLYKLGSGIFGKVLPLRS